RRPCDRTGLGVRQGGPTMLEMVSNRSIDMLIKARRTLRLHKIMDGNGPGCSRMARPLFLCTECACSSKALTTSTRLRPAFCLDRCLLAWATHILDKGNEK